MIKKRKKQSKYIFRNKEFTTFKNMKTYAYFNMETKCRHIRMGKQLNKVKGNRKTARMG